MISDYLTAQGVAVIHIVDGGDRMPHCLSGGARCAGGRLIYDRGSSQQLGWEFKAALVMTARDASPTKMH